MTCSNEQNSCVKCYVVFVKRLYNLLNNNINEHCQLTEKTLKYTLVTTSQNRRKSSLHVYVVFSRNQVR